MRWVTWVSGAPEMEEEEEEERGKHWEKERGTEFLELGNFASFVKDVRRDRT